MNKLIILVCIIAVIAVAAYFLIQPKPAPQPSQPSVEEEAYILDDSLNTLIGQEFEKISIEQTTFNTQVEDEIANSISLFYWV